MRLGIAIALKHNSPEEWAQKHYDLGLKSVVFPLDYTAPENKIDAYAKACRNYDLTIAEAGAWRNVMTSDPVQRKENIRYCQEQLRLAEYLRANCCVNITGSAGEQWDGGYKGNYDPDFVERMIDSIREIVDAVNPEHTFYTPEPMPWMLPDSPESYLELLHKVNRNTVAVHLDIVNMINCPERYLFNEAFTDRCFELLGSRIRSCHIKDTVMAPNLTCCLTEVPCGAGGYNIRHCLKRIDECNPEMPVIIEHLSEEQEYLKAIYYLNELLGKESENG